MYKPYKKGENKELDDLLVASGTQYQTARQNGDWEGMQAANDAANRLRNEYGYASTDASADINKFKPKDAQPSSSQLSTFSYESAPDYISRNQDLINEVMDQILNRPDFEYNPENDPTYQNYEKQYTKAGERAMQDTLGQVSARTGGLASSYAGTVSQQAYNQYMDALSDKIPELEQLAYERYMNEDDMLRDQLNMLMALDQNDFNKYLASLDQYNADRNFGYGLFSDNRNLAYQMGRDQVADSQWQQGFDWQKETDQRDFDYQKQQDELTWAYQKDSDAYNRAMQKWQMTGVLDQESAAILGLPAGTKTTDYQYQLAQMAQMSRSGSGGGGGSNSSSKKSSESSSGDIYKTLYDNGVRSEGDAYAALLSAGYSSTEAGKIAEYFMTMLKNGDFEVDEYEGAEVDLDSVLSLGYGPISADYLDELEKSGKVESYVDNGMIKFRKKKEQTSSPSSGLSGILFK